MAWVKTLPANNSKIRLAPAYITDNWKAIEDGEVPHKYVQFANAVSDPGAAPGWMYAKSNELFLKSQTSGALQLTSSGFLGSGTTNIWGNSGVFTTLRIGEVTFDGTFYNTQQAMAVAWAHVIVTGSSITAQTSYGLTFSRTSTGLYKATFTDDQVANANYIATGTAYTSSGGSEASVLSIAADQAYNTTEFSIRIKHGTNDSNSDRSFNIVVFGGR